MKDEGVEELQSKITNILRPHGFELHPFLIGWYNEQVGEKFHLDHDSDTLAFAVLSQPRMFEDAFLPFLTNTKGHLGSIHDPIDQCMLHYFSLVTAQFPDVVSLHDFQLGPTRRPRVLVQTAGHVSGAARFYQPKDLAGLDAGRKYYPVCHHPVWGGWFAFRGVLIFPSVRADIVQKEPSNKLSEEQAEQLVRMYNDSWQDWRWRDVGREQGELAVRYSDIQMKYFETLPAERFQIIENILQSPCPSV